MDHSTTCKEPGTLFWQMDNDFWGMCRLDSHSSRWPSELDKIYKTNPTCITTVHSMFTYVWLGKHLKVGNKVIPGSDVFQNRKYFTGICSRFLKTKSSQLNTQLSKLFCNSVILQMNSNLSWQSCNYNTTTYKETTNAWNIYNLHNFHATGKNIENIKWKLQILTSNPNKSELFLTNFTKTFWEILQ